MPSSSALDATWIERPLSLDIDGRPVRGTARANWGAVEVQITSPVAHLSRYRDARGWAFAMLAHHRPQERYALDGAFTEKGIRAAQQFLAALYRDWLAVSHHEADVDHACRMARAELAHVRRQFAERVAPLSERRTGLRRAFKGGEFAQSEYQARLKDLSKERERLDSQERDAVASIQARFTDLINLLTGRPIPLAEAERILSEAAIIVET